MRNKLVTAFGIGMLYYMWYVLFDLFKGFRFSSLTIYEATFLMGTICLASSLLTDWNWGIIDNLINNGTQKEKDIL